MKPRSPRLKGNTALWTPGPAMPTPKTHTRAQTNTDKLQTHLCSLYDTSTYSHSLIPEEK